jgi:4-amino-4-deoxychorismate lyase
MARSAALLDLPALDRAAWKRCAQVVIDAWDHNQEMALKLVYTRGIDGGDGTPTGWALGMEIPELAVRRREDGVSALALDRGFATDLADRAPWLLLGAKSLSYAVNMAALRHAAANGAEEVIFTATDGSVLEGATATVVIAKKRSLVTPPTTIGILPGTTQVALFRAAERAGWPTKSEPLRLDDLRAADGVWLVSSVRLITRVHTLDGEPLTDAADLHAELTELYESHYRD